jgi:prophage regulatory protein
MRILRKPEVSKRVGYSAMHIWRLERDGQFPKRIQLGPMAVGWLESEVNDWIKERIAERDAEAD